ncbi:MAG: hypothetical protein IT285_03740 [Bdellovibrionales bacterium]|nr:hypothetical protein [Bdellovibrionales bacterium]
MLKPGILAVALLATTESAYAGGKKRIVEANLGKHEGNTETFGHVSQALPCSVTLMKLSEQTHLVTLNAGDPASITDPVPNYAVRALDLKWFRKIQNKLVFDGCPIPRGVCQPDPREEAMIEFSPTTLEFTSFQFETLAGQQQAACILNEKP